MKRVLLNYYIEKLHIQKDLSREYKLDSLSNEKEANYSVLEPLSKVNIFVGPNNSRKSRFMRLIASEKAFKFETTDPIYTSLVTFAPRFLKEVDKILLRYGLTNYGQIKNQFTAFETKFPHHHEKIIQTGSSYDVRLGEHFDFINRLSGNLQSPGKSMQNEEHVELQNELKELVNKYKQLAEDEGLSESISYVFNKTYIPTLRGFRQFSEIPSPEGDPYKVKTNLDYFSKLEDDTQQPPNIFSGYDLFTSLNALHAGTPEQRAKKKAFETFLSEKFYEGKNVEITPNVNSKIVQIILENEDERPIQDIGDGIQQLMLLFFTMFEHLGKKALFFIEEPEIFMHPGMQRQFLKNLYSEEQFRGFQFFLTTHSNHFLDMTLDYENVSIFRCEKKKLQSKKNITTISNMDSPDTSLLADLGVKNSSVYLTNSTIWVEGVTDRIYYRHFLYLYQKYLIETGKNKAYEGFKEDLNYSFVEYGGSNITHWSFFSEDNPQVERLCGKLLLIVDRDDDSGKKKKRKGRIKAQLGSENFLDLKEVKCREVENLLSKDTLIKVVSEYGRENSHITIDFKLNDFKLPPLGEFIEDVMLRGNKKRTGSYKNEWGSISDKTRFARKAIAHMKSYEELSTPAKKVTQRMYEFISKHNQ